MGSYRGLMGNSLLAEMGAYSVVGNWLGQCCRMGRFPLCAAQVVRQLMGSIQVALVATNALLSSQLIVGIIFAKSVRHCLSPPSSQPCCSHRTGFPGEELAAVSDLHWIYSNLIRHQCLSKFCAAENLQGRSRVVSWRIRGCLHNGTGLCIAKLQLGQICLYRIHQPNGMARRSGLASWGQ